MKKAAKPRRPAQDQRRGRRAVEPNLIITIDERHRGLAMAEVKAIMAKLDVKARITRRLREGLLGVHCPDEPRAVMQRLHALFEQAPLAFQHTHRWIPIEQWAAAEARAIARFADTAFAEIGAQESWRIRAERHGSRLKVEPLIDALAYGIHNRHVDLEAADNTILMEIVGQRAGMAVVREGEILSVDQEMNRFVEFEEIR